MRTLALLALTFPLAAFPSDCSEPCRPTDPCFASALQSADAVIAGRAEKVRKVNSRQDGELVQVQLVRFFVTDSWKGIEPSRSPILLNGGSVDECGNRFEEGRVYMVFVRILEGGYYLLPGSSIVPSPGEKANLAWVEGAFDG